ncbi:MAG: glycosyltransferase family 2 protein, partial [Lachnospiraceae bacterium]
GIVCQKLQIRYNSGHIFLYRGFEMDKIAVLIPCYNEEKTIGKVFEFKLQQVSTLKKILETKN